jgi:hypothetical protein
MPKLRFKIAWLLVLILFFGVGFAALRESSDLGETGLFSATTGILLGSVLLAAHRREPERAFWLGFALFGSSYLGLTLVPSIRPRLITTKLLAYVDSEMQVRGTSLVNAVPYSDSWSQTGQIRSAVFGLGGQRRLANGQGQEWIVDASTGQLVVSFRGSSANFIRIGHSLLALLVAWLGGLISRCLRRGSRRSQVPTQGHPGSQMVASISRTEPARS